MIAPMCAYTCRNDEHTYVHMIAPMHACTLEHNITYVCIHAGMIACKWEYTRGHNCDYVTMCAYMAGHDHANVCRCVWA
jgi:hypothetical protein